MPDNEVSKSSRLELLGIGTVPSSTDENSPPMFTRAFDRRVRIAGASLGIALVIFVGMMVFFNWPSRREAGYMPEQPLDYSHKIHAGDLGIECEYCHSNVAKGPHATVPPISTCMKCHTEVQPKDEKGRLKPNMEKVLDYWKRRKPIVWTKVHVLADFVYFDHSRHIAKEVECEECHGDVKQLEHMRRKFGLKMRFCLDCHTQEETKPDDSGEMTTQQKASVNCTTCHR